MFLGLNGNSSSDTTQCRTCYGTGKSNGLRCPTCNGTGKVNF